MKHTYKIKITVSFLLLGCFLWLSSCKKFIAIDAPRTELVRSTVFENDETVTAASLDQYYQLSTTFSFAGGGSSSVAMLASLSSNELINGFVYNDYPKQFYEHRIRPENDQLNVLWSDLYKAIYRANAIIEGLQNSTKISAVIKAQTLGEAFFLRAFSYYYLCGLFGDPALVLSTDYSANQSIGRSPVEQVINHCMADLNSAEELLQADFSQSGGERIRVNKGACKAMMARIYLQKGDWLRAESNATALISNTEMYRLDDLDKVFLKNSMEAIWQLYPKDGNVLEYSAFREQNHRLSETLLNGFEPLDQRKIDWIYESSPGNFIPNKYKSGARDFSEYSVVLRLAEQYLIRAEARTRLNNFQGARDDINAIRNRAGLDDIDYDDQQSLLGAIEKERKLELFTEWGHRWLDLKRMGNVNSVMSMINPGWQSTDALYPIPKSQIMNSPGFSDHQNPGY